MKWGILATGTIAANFARTLTAMNSPEERMVAVGSRNPEKSRQFADTYGIERAYGSYEELAADPEVEAIYIATPNNMHYENALLALNAGKHVLCEKPFTTCARDAETLYRIAEEKGLFIMEAFWIRFLPLYGQLLEIIRSERYGKLRHARVEYGFIAKGARRERKFKSELGGGALLDIGVYTLGFLRMLMGANPVDFTSRVQLNEYGTDEFSLVQLLYPEGQTATALQTIGMQIERQAALYFDRASIYLPDFQLAFSMTVKPLEGEEYTVDCPPEFNGYEYEIREVSRCVAAGQCHSAIHSPELSLDTLRLLDALRESWTMKFSYEE